MNNTILKKRLSTQKVRIILNNYQKRIEDMSFLDIHKRNQKIEGIDIELKYYLRTSKREDETFEEYSKRDFQKYQDTLRILFETIESTGAPIPYVTN